MDGLTKPRTHKFIERRLQAYNPDFPTWVEYMCRVGWFIRGIPSGDYGECVFHQWIHSFVPMNYEHVTDQVRLVLGPNPWASETGWEQK